MNTGQDPAALMRNFDIILGTQRFDEYVTLYRETPGLPLWFEKEGLCSLRFGSG